MTRLTAVRWILVLIVACVSVVGLQADDTAWRDDLDSYRDTREQELRSPTGWLTLTGLHWLQEGENRFGSREGVEVPLPDVAPPVAGTLTLTDGAVTLRVTEGAVVQINGETVGEATLRDDSQSDRDLVELADRLSFYLVKRGDRVGVRARDTEHPALLAFEGLDFFPVTPELRIDATFKPFDEPLERAISNVIGTKLTMQVPGVIQFEIAGEKYELEPFAEPGATSLWILFKDGTSGRESYGFRYLSAELREDGSVDLDFNRAYNPPCAFTPYATCPMPPRKNRLGLRIEAGERKYSGPH